MTDDPVLEEENRRAAESIIRCEGLTFALAIKVGGDQDMRKARKMLKERIVKELDRAMARGSLL